MISTKFKPGDLVTYDSQVRIDQIYRVITKEEAEEILSNSNHSFISQVEQHLASLVIGVLGGDKTTVYAFPEDQLVALSRSEPMPKSKLCVCDFRSVIMIRGCRCGGV